MVQIITFYGGGDKPVNDWIERNNRKIKIIDIKTAFNSDDTLFYTVIYQLI